MGALLKVLNLDKKYYLSKNEYQHVLKGVSFELNKGELVALVGESGSGKTTLLNIIGGLDSDYLGSVVVKGHFIRKYSEKQIDDYRKKRIGFIFQSYNLIAHMNILENVMIAMEMSDVKQLVKEERAYELLRLVGLEHQAKKYPPQLSGGQKQRVAIARALANNPSIILADEPTGALDKEAEVVILEILKKIVATGKLVVVVTHSQIVANHCNRIIHLDDGVIASDKKNGTVVINGEYEKVIMPKKIKFKQLLKLSYRNLKQKFSRTLLVSIGISIGIAAVMLILALSSGLNSYVNDLYADNLASNQITVLNQNDSQIYSNQVTNVSEIDGVKSVIETAYLSSVKYSTTDLSSSIYQLGSFYSDYYPSLLLGTIPKSGGYIIVNETMALEVADDTIIAALGKEVTLTISNTDYTYIVAAIFDDQSSYPHKSRAYVISSDFTTMKSNATTNALYITIKDITYLNEVLEELSQLGFKTYQADNTASNLLNYIDIGTAVLTALTALSLVVCAIMIFIVLYISIIERTKEIGILRAIGASRSDIRNMVAIEAILIGSLGGLIAVGFTILITIVANVFTGITLDFNMIEYNVLYYFLGILISVIIAFLSGLAPAIKASNFDPVEALRYE